ncbi:hypothetical protein ACJX0J_012000, partial [Zea mays]
AGKMEDAMSALDMESADLEGDGSASYSTKCVHLLHHNTLTLEENCVLKAGMPNEVDQIMLIASGHGLLNCATIKNYITNMVTTNNNILIGYAQIMGKILLHCQTKLMLAATFGRLIGL